MFNIDKKEQKNIIEEALTATEKKASKFKKLSENPRF